MSKERIFLILVLLVSNSVTLENSFVSDYNEYMQDVFLHYDQRNLSSTCRDALKQINFLQSKCKFVFEIIM